MYGNINFSRIETEPGTASAFAPPAGWGGDGAAYRNLMRQRWKTDPGVRQHVVVVGRMLERGNRVVFLGRFADEARRIAEAAREGDRHDHMA